jgi:hypothetical protein
MSNIEGAHGKVVDEDAKLEWDIPLGEDNVSSLRRDRYYPLNPY